MCGIAGFWRPGGVDASAVSAITLMTDSIRHRGPDDSGSWIDAEAGLVFGQRRLAIIDLSAEGHQPMHSRDGRYVIVFNGEIYNFADLRARLDAEGATDGWRGHSDTEVLLAAIQHWGLPSALKAANGMFAFALWDRATRKLILARDRMGEKPLYFGWQGAGADRAFLFGSDLASLRAHPSFEGRINHDSVAMMTRYLYVPEPYSIYEGITKLTPGTWLSIGADGTSHVSVYWDTLSEYEAANDAGRFQGSAEEAVDAVEAALSRAVARQSIADVPLGAFLSGGVDSSTVVALMQAQSVRRVKTFSIGFTVDSYNEAPFARAVAEHLGTEHEELIVGPDEAMAVIPDLAGIYSEPFADSSQIPTILVSRMARQQVTVALSGDAGDELFAGYNRHLHGYATWPRLSATPRLLRSVASVSIHAVPPSVIDRLAGLLTNGRLKNAGEKLHKAAGVVDATSVDELYDRLVSLNGPGSGLMKSGGSAGQGKITAFEALCNLHPVDQMMALDATQYLPGDILTKVDRAAMSASLETRVPMLDVDVMRLAWSLPVEFKIRDGQTKWPLRQVLYRHVPKELIDRPKAGFGIPIGDWLRGPLRDWAEALLDDRANPLSDYFEPRTVWGMWHDHLSGKRNSQHRLWPVLMFQAWRGTSRA